MPFVNTLQLVFLFPSTCILHHNTNSCITHWWTSLINLAQGRVYIYKTAVLAHCEFDFGLILCLRKRKNLSPPWIECKLLNLQLTWNLVLVAHRSLDIEGYPAT